MKRTTEPDPPDGDPAGQGDAAKAPGGASPQQLANWGQFWRMMFEPFQGLFDSSLGRKLEDEGIAVILDEDKSVKADYSFYKDLRGSN